MRTFSNGIFQQCGAQAFSIVFIISLLVGMIFAFVGAVQLNRSKSPMQGLSWQAVSTTPLSWLLLPVLLMACQSSPADLYLLSAQPAPTQSDLSEATVVTSASRRATRLGDPGELVGTIGIAVAVPEYLDRLDIVERAGDNKLKPSHDAQWAESLSIDATRVVGEDLEALLPSANVVILPSRARRSIDYEIDMNLVRFESNAAGESLIAGAWTIAASDGHELASGRFRRSEPIGQRGLTEMAAAMSRNLAAVSADLAYALRRLVPSRQYGQGKTIASSSAQRTANPRKIDTPVP
jgi:uncharacterized lipoprotein YmbA